MATKTERILRAIKDFDGLQDHALGTVLENLHDTLNTEKGLTYEQLLTFFHGVAGVHVTAMSNLSNYFLEKFDKEDELRIQFINDSALSLTKAVTYLLPKSLPPEIMERQCEVMSKELIDEMVKEEIRH